MSGIVQNNILRSSGTIAVTAAGLSWGTAVVTGSTVTVEAGNGYWINTTSNTCTITLPSSAESGDQIVLIDYARTWGTNKIIIDSNGLNFQGNADTYTVEYETDGQSVNIVYSDATKGWLPLEDDVTALEPSPPPTQKAIFGFGKAGSSKVATTNLVNSSGVVASDTSGVGTASDQKGAASYGSDKGIFGYGDDGSGKTNITNKVSNSGVVASNTSGVGSARFGLAACSYGSDKAIFGYGSTGGGSGKVSITNLISNSGVAATDTTGVGTARFYLTATSFGGDKGIFGFGTTGIGGSANGVTGITNIVSNQGVVASDTTGVGQARFKPSAAIYGGDKATFLYGTLNESDGVSTQNLVSNVGVVASNNTATGTARFEHAGAGYGGDKAIFGFGSAGDLSMTNLVSNTGVVASDVSGVGTGRGGLSACGFSLSA